MYYDRNQGKFKCYVKVTTNPVAYNWQDCGGGGGPWEPTVPFIIKDSVGNIVLEINQE